MKILTVPDFLQFLTSCTAADFKNDAVDQFLSQSEFVEEAFLPFAHFLDETYGRNLVYRNEHFELLVLTWLPGHRTSIHGHANQRCWMFVEAGELTFKNYQVSGKSQVKPQGDAETRKARQRIYIDDEIGLHSIANASSKPAISVHLYANPIPSCKSYDPINKKFETNRMSYLTESVWSTNWELLDTPVCDPEMPL